MSPSGLGRCLRCSDATFERLAALLDAGFAGSRRLPKVKRILTLPAGRFDEILAQLRAARAEREAAQAVRAAGSASAGAADGGSEADGESDLEVAAWQAPSGGGGGDDDDDSDDEDDSGLLWAPEGDLAARRPSVMALAAGLESAREAGWRPPSVGANGSDINGSNANGSGGGGRGPAASVDAVAPLSVV
jgi:hypothetical protein